MQGQASSTVPDLTFIGTVVDACPYSRGRLSLQSRTPVPTVKIRMNNMDNNVISIGGRREVFWDDFFIDSDRTTAGHRLIPPVKADIGFVFDRPDERHSISYPNVVRDENGFKLYYITFDPSMERRRYKLHVLESEDGLNWTRPALDLFPNEDGGSTNVVIDWLDDSSLCVFYDTNPACPADERYKVMTLVFRDRKLDIRTLWCYASGDGYHFKKPFFVTDKGRFDSLNPFFWKDGTYSKEAHKALAEGYVADERFRAYYDKIAEGCTEFSLYSLPL